MDEQERILARIESGVDFRQEELVGALQAVVSSRFFAIGAPPTAGIKEGEFIARNRRHKGVDSRFAPHELKRIDAPVHFDMSTQAMPFEWHELEGEPPNTYRWTGLSPSATIDLPVIFDRDLLVRIQVIAMMRPELIDSIRLSMHGRPLAFEIDRSQPLLGLVTKLRRAEIAETDRDFGITIEVPVTRPFDLGLERGSPLARRCHCLGAGLAALRRDHRTPLTRPDHRPHDTSRSDRRAFRVEENACSALMNNSR